LSFNLHVFCISQTLAETLKIIYPRYDVGSAF